MRFLIILPCLFLFFACTEQEKKPDKNKINIGSRTIAFDRGESPSKLNMKFQCFYSSYDLFSDSLSIHYFYSQREVLILHLESGLRKVIALDKPFVERHELENANVYNVNGTVYFANRKGEIYRWQDSTAVLEFSINNDPVMKKRMLVMNEGMGFTRDFTFINEYELIFQCIPSKEGWKKIADHYPILAKLNLKTKKITVFNYTFRRELADETRPMMSDIYQTVADGKLLVSYMFSPVVDVISLKTGKQTGTITLKSTYQGRDIPSLGETYTDFEKERFPIETEFYGPIVYNPHKNCYYRIFYHRLPERNAQDEFTISMDKKASVAIFDRKHRWVGEVNIDVPMIGAITPTKEGFLLNLNKVKIKENTVYFKTYYHD